MKKFAFLVIATCVTASCVHAQSSYWRDQSGNPVPTSDSMKSQDDFGGSMLITTDDDWREKWNTPPDTKPNFRKADVVPYGKKIYVLTFFSNPKIDTAGKANVRCDIQITAPTGKVSMSQRDMTCFSGAIAGSLYNLYLSAPVVAFRGDPGDPPGNWLVEVSLRDANRNVVLPLKASFQLK
jgi:hypothetical protein